MTEELSACPSRPVNEMSREKTLNFLDLYWLEKILMTVDDLESSILSSLWLYLINVLLGLFVPCEAAWGRRRSMAYTANIPWPELGYRANAQRGSQGWTLGKNAFDQLIRGGVCSSPRFDCERKAV